MPTQRIPCDEYAGKKSEIELTGNYKVTSCEPIAGDPGWCEITFIRVSETPAETGE